MNLQHDFVDKGDTNASQFPSIKMPHSLSLHSAVTNIFSWKVLNNNQMFIIYYIRYVVTSNKLRCGV